MSIINLLGLEVEETTYKVKNRESSSREFKRNFDKNNLPKYAKICAAFANKNGGDLFFGIQDRPRLLIGVDENTIPDDVVVSNFLKEYFEPQINFEINSKSIDARHLLCIRVKEASHKPVICKKQKVIKSKNEIPEKTILRSGSIYYRYASSTNDIQYPELKSILDNEVNNVFKSLVENVSLIQKVGYDKAAVVSALGLDGNDKVVTVYLTKDTAKSLNWIEEGRFTNDETQGSKAYYVTKNVEIKQGISLDYSKTHPLTKTGLAEKVKMLVNQLNAVLWKLKISDNPNFHIPNPHGKTTFHKFSESTQQKILENYPLPTDESEKNQRKSQLKELVQQYEAQKNKK